MTTFVPRRLNILCIMFNIITFFIITLFARLNARLAFYSEEGGWAHKTSITLPLFIEVPVPSQESERSCICVLGVSILPLSTILLLDFRTVPTVLYFLLFILSRQEYIWWSKDINPWMKGRSIAYILLYNTITHPVICEGWYFEPKQSHHFTKIGGLGSKNYFKPATFIIMVWNH